jgi:hypothetical protein
MKSTVYRKITVTHGRRTMSALPGLVMHKEDSESSLCGNAPQET